MGRRGKAKRGGGGGGGDVEEDPWRVGARRRRWLEAEIVDWWVWLIRKKM